MKGVTDSRFGTTIAGNEIQRFRLENDSGCAAAITTYGATLTELHVPDGWGNMGNIVLGFPTVAQYEAAQGYIGSTIGRYANRIADARFTLEGRQYHPTRNDGNNCLHGGSNGFDKRIWQVAPEPTNDGVALALTYISEDMEEGFPGRLHATIIYTLSDNDFLEVRFRAKAEKTTPVNLTHHSYFNLNGSGTVLDHNLWIDADRFTETDENLCSTGNLRSVHGSPLDFTSPATIGERINAQFHGYDHNYCLKAPSMQRKSATVSSRTSLRRLNIYTDQPGLQVYTGNFLSLETTCGQFSKYGGLALEAQNYPDAINQPHFPNSVLLPGELYERVVRYEFAVMR
jgi:aldose 1-epimerase